MCPFLDYKMDSGKSWATFYKVTDVLELSQQIGTDRN